MRRRELLFGLIALAACKRGDTVADAPHPREITDAATAQFCGMALTEHAGPKAQIFIRGLHDPYWFATVRDAFAFTMLQEMPKAISAIYVSDMARAKNWDQPEPGIWVEAHQAYFVIGSRRRSGMGTDEAIPFSARRRGARLRRRQWRAGCSLRRHAARLHSHHNAGRPMKQLTRRRFIAITAAAGGLPLLPIVPAHANSLLRVWSGTALGCDATLQIHHPDPADRRPADRGEPRRGGASRTDHEPLSARQRSFAPQPRGHP